MKILIIGGAGMLGHQLFVGLSADHEVRVTLRRPMGEYADFGLFSPENAYCNIDLRSPELLEDVLTSYSPDAIVNASGIVKQRPSAQDPVVSIEVNALFPHRLALMAAANRSRLLHVSTDCVFSGRRGGYSEDDLPDPLDLYGRSKLLGELDQDGTVTLRTSIIGRELGRQQGLLEWSLAVRGEVRGFRRAVFSGLTTQEFTRVCGAVLSGHADLKGVWHVASEPISKYELLVELFNKLGRTDVQVVPDDSVVCDRSLRADAFERATGYRAPTWSAMIAELCDSIRTDRT